MPIEWKYDNNNLRIPYWNNQKIDFIKINNEQYIYNYISSNITIKHYLDKVC